MQKQIEAAIHEYWASVESLDARRYRENFASDATLEDPVGTNNIQGAEAIAAFFRDGIQAWNIGRVAPAIQHVIVGTGQSTEAAVAWELTVHREAGQCMVIQGIGFFKFKPNHADGRLLLESVREFWTPQSHVFDGDARG
jgi:ketosteroid isomerase-like protein